MLESQYELLTKVVEPVDHLLRGVLHSDHVSDLLGHVVQAVSGNNTIRRHGHPEHKILSVKMKISMVICTHLQCKVTLEFVM